MVPKHDVRGLHRYVTINQAFSCTLRYDFCFTLSDCLFHFCCVRYATASSLPFALQSNVSFFLFAVCCLLLRALDECSLTPRFIRRTARPPVGAYPTHLWVNFELSDGWSGQFVQNLVRPIMLTWCACCLWIACPSLSRVNLLYVFACQSVADVVRLPRVSAFHASVDTRTV